MPTPPKPVALLKQEKKSHRTKKELELREKGEEALATGVPIKPFPNVRENAVAYKEFKRILNLLKIMNKDDAIYQSVINRYCLIFAECIQLENLKHSVLKAMDVLSESFEGTLENMEEEARYSEAVLKIVSKFTRELNTLFDQQAILEKQIQTKRKMLFDIEKENIMTISAALRSIPKKVDNGTNPLLEALNGG